ncbi:hypothetical protein SAMN06265375_1011149 [Muriicola jejuensis]|uniref:Uncharacterized protein n=1 Tax=Muriicola jejuensis TaxID=504488 RepID=A0A6P0UDL6_9FLAO|nr:hypothetical protein [Muriicola jejuensis]NER09353.1 hypothetical protein [Muriicola jejuensis]SMP09198.1 hypothetical protein SAMN06265375_1011149 [Muriicola jejuensis]
MEKNRLDKKIKETLENRRICPSRGAWNRIEEQLGSELPSPNKTYWRFGIAAGFIGILFVSVLLMNRNEEPGSVNIELVETDSQPAEEKRTGEEWIDPPESEKWAVLSDPGLGAETIPENRTAEGKLTEKQIVRSPKTFEESPVNRSIPHDKVDIMVARVVSQVASLEDSGAMVEDEVIDSLLRSAQEQLIQERAASASPKVDAMALLSEVEGDLNRSFRDQLFDKLKEGYLKVRTAVAYRNQ